jgi:hypothetical protein
MALVILPWTVRNWVQIGSPILISSNTGWNAVIGHNRDANGAYMAPGGYFLNTLDTPEPEREGRINSQGIRLAREYALEHPAHELELSVRKAQRLWKADDDAIMWQELNLPDYLGATEREVLKDTSNWFYFAVLALGVAGVLSSTGGERGWRLLVILLTLGWTAFHILLFADNRLHYPLSPVLSVCAAGGIVAIASFVSGALRARNVSTP